MRISNDENEIFGKINKKQYMTRQPERMCLKYALSYKSIIVKTIFMFRKLS